MSKRGRPFEPGNKIGRGRPKGSRNQRTLIGKELLEEHGEAIVRKAMALALKGDVPMLRALLPYVLGKAKDLTVVTGPLQAGTLEDLAKAYDTLIGDVASGHLQVDQAQGIVNILEARRHMIETEELAARVKKVEQLVLPDSTQSDEKAA